MYYAENAAGESTRAVRGETATCPSCREELLGKAGEIVTTPYWSHRAGTDCDDWTKADPMTEWHLGWQELVTRGRTEVTMRRDGLWHRADIVAQDGQVVEIQKSSITPVQIGEREEFYGDMVWIWNVIEPREAQRLKLMPSKDWELPKRFRTFVWKSPWKSIGFCTKPVFFDLGEDWLLHVGAIEPDPFAGWGLLVHKRTVAQWINNGPPGRPVDPRIALRAKRHSKIRELPDAVDLVTRELGAVPYVPSGPRRPATVWDLGRDDLAWNTYQFGYDGLRIELRGAGLKSKAEVFDFKEYHNRLGQCSCCGEPLTDASLTEKCRDWHGRCNQCFARYDEPKNPGCRRRKHRKEEPK